MVINLQELPIPQRQAWLQHAIAPRPIAFASTVDKEGNANLSPFSFFNLFSSNPPVVIFSPARSGRDNKLKNTLENVLEVPEVVIGICNYSMVQQVSLSSCEYAKGTDEFVKAGFTKEKATVVRPYLIKESFVNLECKVLEVKSLGEFAGAGQLVIAEVICMHVKEEVLNEDKSMIDTAKMNFIARLGGDCYGVMNKVNLFIVPKPNKDLGIGVDALPESIRTSKYLTGNDLGLLANVTQLPMVDNTFEDEKLTKIIQYYAVNPTEMEKELHFYAHELLGKEQVQKAWQILLAADNV
jgi:flavin reductase (DIM6/NTAB) family NADH-FMN oxidoreductase RutF